MKLKVVVLDAEESELKERCCGFVEILFPTVLVKNGEVFLDSLCFFPCWGFYVFVEFVFRLINYAGSVGFWV